MRAPRSPRRLLAAAASLALAAGVAGCSSGDSTGDPSGAAAFVIGARSNMPAPQLDGHAMAALDQAVENQSLASIVVADGEPSVLGTMSLTVEGANGTAREQSREDNRRGLAAGITAARADDEETDLLAALDDAARSISSVETLPRTIVVVDSGLSTVAPLDFTQPGLLDADPQEVADSLSQADALPDLSGVTVVTQGLGDTAPPQVSLTIAQRRNLVAIWQAVLEAAGGDVVVEQTQLIREPADDLPNVTPVELPAGPACSGDVVELTGAAIAFEPDTARFVDRAAVDAVLEPIAEQLVEYRGSAALTGTTAAVGDLEGQRALSLERAQAVQAALVRLGVPPAHLTAFGVGSEFPGYVQDHDGEGNLQPGPAAQNRKVIVEVSGGVGALICG